MEEDNRYYGGFLSALVYSAWTLFVMNGMGYFMQRSDLKRIEQTEGREEAERTAESYLGMIRENNRDLSFRVLSIMLTSGEIKAYENFLKK